MNSTIKNYYELCKPNVVLMMLITALVGSLLASKTLAPLSLIAFAMLGIGLCASSAAAINQIIDRKADAKVSNAVSVFTQITKIVAPSEPKIKAKIEALTGLTSP